MFANAMIAGFHQAARRAARDEENCLTYTDKNGKRRKRKEVKARVRLCYTYVQYRKGIIAKLVQLSDIKQA